MQLLQKKKSLILTSDKSKGENIMCKKCEEMQKMQQNIMENKQAETTLATEQQEQMEIKHLENCISIAMDDYERHTDATEVLERIGTGFIQRLAEDSYYAKKELRELFRKSPAWNEELQALVINGNKTRNTDYSRVYTLLTEILVKARDKGEIRWGEFNAIAYFFCVPKDEELQKIGLETINRIAPKAYAVGKKPSRVFKAICKELGIADETAGSEFQKLYAELADELSAKKIDFKLFVSINPAHFLTMSNPKEDRRGCTLTSCHSLNSIEYEYNNGCSGYARDNTSFIVFTVANPEVPELLNNRKTTRQVFAYKVGNGVLLQSRLYNTNGGTSGAQEESKLYRDLIQRELSELENKTNLWITKSSTGEWSEFVKVDYDFHGYPDWHYEDFNGKISIRKDAIDNCVPILVGDCGLCLECGCETEGGVLCSDCNSGDYCDCCDALCCADEFTRVYDEQGNEIYVCNDCLNLYYIYCDCCQEYHHRNNICYIEKENADVCIDCVKKYYTICDSCGEYVPNYNLPYIKNLDMYICVDCLNEYYKECDCGAWVENGQEECPECGHSFIEETEEGR